MLALILLVSMLPLSALAASPFADVTESDWFLDAVNYVYEKNIMSGTGKGFEPTTNTTRAMMWTMLARLDGVDMIGAHKPWYVAAQQWCKTIGISDGTAPDGVLTREQLACMLYRFAQYRDLDVQVDKSADLKSYDDFSDVSAWAAEAMRWACSVGILKGDNGRLLPKSYASRAQVATMLYRYDTQVETAERATVTFEMNCDDLGTYKTVFVKLGASLEKPASPSREDYTFAGWYTASEGGKLYTFPVTVMEDMTLYAHWVPTVACNHTEGYTYQQNDSKTHTVLCAKCGDVVNAIAPHERAEGKEWMCVCGYALQVWDGTAASAEELASITDAEAKTVTIQTANQLAALAQSVNAGNTYLGYTITLEADLDLGGRNWTPIGTKENPFRARVFDGKNHTISYLRCNGGATNPIDKEATCQGLFGCTYTGGMQIVEVMNLNLHNADIYAMNSAGALIGCVDSEQSAYWLGGYTGVHDIKLTGKVTIEGGNSGGIAGSPVGYWTLQTGYKHITIDADEGSYLSNLKARELSGEGVGGALGGIVAIAAWDRGSEDLTSNLNLFAAAGNVGGIVSIGNQYWKNIHCTGNVTVKNVDAETFNDKMARYYGTAIGCIAPTYTRAEMSQARKDSIVATGELRIELTDGRVVTSNAQESNKIGGWAY